MFEVLHVLLRELKIVVDSDTDNDDLTMNIHGTIDAREEMHTTKKTI